MDILLTLFRTILLTTAMGSIVVGLIVLLKYSLGDRLSPQWHYLVWFLLLARLLIPYGPQTSWSIFNLSPELPVSWQESHQPAAMPGEDQGDSVSATHPAAAKSSAISGKEPVPAVSGPPPVLVVLAVIWALGAGVALARALAGSLSFYRRVSSHPVWCNLHVSEMVEEIRTLLNIGRDIPVVVTGLTSVPALCGWLRPRILIPEKLMADLNLEQLQHIVMHELLHWKRRDILLNYITGWLEALHWFNPVIRWGFRRMRMDGELACDAQVLAYLGKEERLRYGHTILHVTEKMSGSPWMLVATGFTGGKRQITRRIRRIAEFRKESWPMMLVSLLLLAMLGVLTLTNGKTDEPVPSPSPEQLELQQVLAGTTDLEGEGVIVTVDDSGESPQDKPEFLVHDMDLIMIVNELSGAGAEAIAVNDQRLVATSEIACAGTTILVNRQRLTPPFVIKAIGSSRQLSETLQLRGSHMETLKVMGLSIEVEAADRVFIPKYQGKLRFHYAKPTRPETPPAHRQRSYTAPLMLSDKP